MMRIMQIERELTKLRQDSDYSRIKDNLQVLRNPSTGGNIRINDPKKLASTIELRKNYEKLKEYIVTYEAMLVEHEERIDKLVREKARLRSKVFA